MLDPPPQVVKQFEQSIPHHEGILHDECDGQQPTDHAQKFQDPHPSIMQHFIRMVQHRTAWVIGSGLQLLSISHPLDCTTSTSLLFPIGTLDRDLSPTYTFKPESEPNFDARIDATATGSRSYFCIKDSKFQ